MCFNDFASDIDSAADKCLNEFGAIEDLYRQCAGALCFDICFLRKTAQRDHEREIV